jgi:hypothetical protein
MDLLARDTEFPNKLVNAHILDVLEHRGNRRAGSFEDLRATSLAGNTFDGGAL